MRWIPTIITDVGDADEVELEIKPGVSGQHIPRKVTSQRPDLALAGVDQQRRPEACSSLVLRPALKASVEGLPLPPQWREFQLSRS